MSLARWLAQRGLGLGRRRPPPVFAEVLRTTLAEDDGLILRLSAYEKMEGATRPVRGWPADGLTPLIRRSWTIFDGRARRTGARREE